MTIEPAYVTFEQAKILREIGFRVKCRMVFDQKGEPYNLTDLISNIKNFDSASKWLADVEDNFYLCPEQWQVIEWIKSVKGIQLFLGYTYCDVFYYNFKWVRSNGENEEVTVDVDSVADQDGTLSYSKAYSIAFDHILNKLKEEKDKEVKSGSRPPTR